ncbi:endoribonuclease MazF [Parapusillimonas sp. SGNA-6]|jgi:mRNA interferase MazF|nr:endoribonuclease MazF [Parapusillimonas sp. SGNA-6]
MPQRYLPNTGDILWLHLDIPGGHPGADHRPALVLSPSGYNKKTGLMVCCAMTSDIKGYPFEVLITADPPMAVLADQVKSLNWSGAKISHRGRVSSAELAEVRAKLQVLILKS